MRPAKSWLAPGLGIVLLGAARLAGCTPFGTEIAADAGPATPGASDASSESTSTFSPPDGTCPASCSRCTNGACEIDCPGPKCAGEITCPPGLPCIVKCSDTSSCSPKKIDCASATSCRVDCVGGPDTCEAAEIKAGAGPLCLSCAGGDRTCDNVKCESSHGCTRVCVGSGCTPSATCPNCSTAPACP